MEFLFPTVLEVLTSYDQVGSITLYTRRDKASHPNTLLARSSFTCTTYVHELDAARVKVSHCGYCVAIEDCPHNVIVDGDLVSLVNLHTLL